MSTLSLVETCPVPMALPLALGGMGRNQPHRPERTRTRSARKAIRRSRTTALSAQSHPSHWPALRTLLRVHRPKPFGRPPTVGRRYEYSDLRREGDEGSTRCDGDVVARRGDG